MNVNWNTKIRKVLYAVVMAALVLTLFFGAGGAPAARAKTGEMSGSLYQATETPVGWVELTTNAKNAFLTANPGTDPTLLFVSDTKQQLPWAFGIVGAKAAATDSEPNLFLFLGNYQSGHWTVSLEATNQFILWITQVPNTLVGSDLKLILSSQVRAQSSSSNLSLPFQTGETWILNGGPHRWSTSTPNTPWSSLDFAMPQYVSGKVRAANDGIVTYSSLCPNYILISHSDGYKTSYYHVANIIVANGQNITRGTVLGDTSTEVGCGGYAPVKHLHFTLRDSSSQPIAIDGTAVGGWIVHNGSVEYGGYLQKVSNGQQVNQYGSIYNDGTIGFGNTPPGPFGKIAPQNITSTSATLSWGPSNAAQIYYYCFDKILNSQCDQQNPNWTPNDPPTDRDITVTGLEPGTTYEWQVQATNSNGYALADNRMWWTFTTAGASCFTLTKSASPSAGGTVNASPVPNCNNGTQYTNGTVVTLTAVPNNGYAFSNWSGDVSGISNPTAVTMTAAKSVTANFVKPVQMQNSYVIGHTLWQGLWRGNQGWYRLVPINTNNEILWNDPSAVWHGPLDISGLPGSGELQEEGDYVVGTNLWQGIWRGNQGWYRIVPILDAANNLLDWNAASAIWHGPLDISGLPGSGNIQMQDSYVIGHTLWQGLWRGNQGWYRLVPINTNNEILWNDPSAVWHGPLDISGLPGSGELQAEGDYVVGTNLWQGIWRGNQGWYRIVPILDAANNLLDWNAASAIWHGPLDISGLPGG